MAVSGVINALVRIAPAELFSTPYGTLVIAKMVALLALGVSGWLQRRRAVDALRRDPSASGVLIRLALVEAAVFGITYGVAVGLGEILHVPLELRLLGRHEGSVALDVSRRGEGGHGGIVSHPTSPRLAGGAVPGGSTVAA